MLVCCTGGEQGEILNPALDSDEVRRDLPQRRLRELQSASRIIGYDCVELLGYRDSGMAGSEANNDPECFARAGATEAVGRLVEMIRRHRPQVLVTYGDDQEVYPHPDHLRVHDISIAAFDAAGDSDAYDHLGEAWQVAKLYYSVFPLQLLQQLHEELGNRGEESPFPDDIMKMEHNDHTITTRVNIESWAEVSRDALRAHETQIDPNSALWFEIVPEIERRLGRTDDYVLARSLVAGDESSGDLFSGLRG